VESYSPFDDAEGFNVRRLQLICCLCIAAVLADTESTLGASDDQLQQLIDRLDAAEARIKELEEQPTQDADTPLTLKNPFTQASSHDELLGDTDSDLSEVVKDWDERWNKQAETNDALKKAISRSVQPGSSGTKSMKLSGRIHADYWGVPNSSAGINRIETARPGLPLGNPNGTPQDRFGFRRLRFGVGGDVSPNMGYRIEMEFAGGNNSEFRDAFIQIQDAGWLQTVIIGNHKRPYGLDQLNSSRHNVFLERPFIVEAFNQDARRLGVSSNGVSRDQSWNWRYGVWNQRLIQDEGNYTSDHLQGEVAGRLANTYWYDEHSSGRDYAHWGISATFAHPDGSTNAIPLNNGQTEAINETRFRTRAEARTVNRWLDTGIIARTDWYEMFGLEKLINIGPFQIVGEYQNLFVQRDSGLGDVHLHGGYVYASYFLTGEHMPWNRKTGTLDRVKPIENFFMVDRCCGGTGTGWGALQLALRYSYADLNDRNINGGIGEATTFGLNWLWNANTRLQLNYITGNIRNRNVGGALRGGPYDIVGARFMIDF